MSVSIQQAQKEHAPIIGKAVVEAVGHEICGEFAAPHHTLTDVEHLFATLAARPDAQYSYLNTLVAVDDATGEVAGVIIGYDGALLHTLREQFFKAVKELLGRSMDNMPDETDPGEFYLDTLYVAPDYRRRGIGGRLLKAMVKRAHAMGKPAGLLVDKTNPNARRLYEATGFKRVGDRPFADTMMDHMLLPL